MFLSLMLGILLQMQEELDILKRSVKLNTVQEAKLFMLKMGLYELKGLIEVNILL